MVLVRSVVTFKAFERPNLCFRLFSVWTIFCISRVFFKYSNLLNVALCTSVHNIYVILRTFFCYGLPTCVEIFWWYGYFANYRDISEIGLSRWVRISHVIKNLGYWYLDGYVYLAKGYLGGMGVSKVGIFWKVWISLGVGISREWSRGLALFYMTQFARQNAH